MTKLGLTLNEAKASLNDARKERFEFLGYSFGPHYPYKSKVRMCLGASPSKKSVQRLRTKVGELLVQSNTAPWPDVRDPLNRILRGWSNNFCYGARAAAYRSAAHSVRERVRDFLARRHKLAGRGNRRFRDVSPMTTNHRHNAALKLNRTERSSPGGYGSDGRSRHDVKRRAR